MFFIVAELGILYTSQTSYFSQGKKITPCLGWQSRIWGGNYVRRNVFKCIPRIVRLLYERKKSANIVLGTLEGEKNPFTYGFSP